METPDCLLHKLALQAKYIKKNRGLENEDGAFK
jgi:hypothetical protein